MRKVRMDLMFLDELEAEIARSGIAYIPCGSMEWHGPHLTVGCDFLRARAQCEGAAQATGGVVLPPMWVASAGYSAFRGSIVFSGELVIRFGTELLRELEKMGFRLAIFVLGHGGPVQEECFTRACEEHGEGRPLRGMVIAPPGNLDPHPRWTAHAGPWETGETLAACAEAVDLERYRPNEPKLPKYDADPATYQPGLSPRGRADIDMHMAWTKWKWDPKLVAKVTPEQAEAWLAEDIAGIVKDVKRVVGEE